MEPLQDPDGAGGEPVKNVYYLYAGLKHEKYPIGPIVYVEDLTPDEATKFYADVRNAVRLDLANKMRMNGEETLSFNDVFKELTIVIEMTSLTEKPTKYSDVEKLAVKMRKKLTKEGKIKA